MKRGRLRAASVPLGVGLLRALEWNHRTIKCVAFDPGLHKLAGGGLDGTVTVWDTANGSLLRTFERRRSTFEWQRGEVASVAFDPAGRMLASGSTNGAVNIWDTASGELLHSCPGEGHSVASVAFHPTEQMLASGADDGTQLVDDCFVRSADRAVRLLAWPSILQGKYLPGVALTGRSFCGTRKTAHYRVCWRSTAIPFRALVLSQADACWQSAASTIP